MIETVEDMVDVFSKSTAKLQERIAELEQENERLREALQEIASDDYEDLSHHTMVMIAKDALQESSDG